jgi:RHS repeat-associated protein
VVSSNASGTDTAYAWDADERLQSVTDNRTSGVTTYTYDQTSQLSTMAYPNGVSHVFQYDSRDRTIQLNVNGPSAAITSYQQTFSYSGRKLSATEMNGRAANYGYDAIYRLTTEAISSDPTASNNGMLTYALDPVGNRQSLTSTLAALASESFTYDADDRLTTDTYDANGNTLTSGGVTYTYDFEDRLLTTSTGITIVYDGDGNRVSENGTKYLVDDLTPTGYAQVAEELVGGSVSAQFTYGVMRISQNRAGTVSYYAYDAGGSVRQLVNTIGVVTDTYAYDAFGNIVAESGSTTNEFLYRGEQYDASLGMYYLRARYYVPRTGRFLTADKYEGEDPRPCECADGGNVGPHLESHHQFSYADGDPINLIDPSGDGAVMDFVVRSLKLGLIEGMESASLGKQLFMAGRYVTFIVCRMITATNIAAIPYKGFKGAYPPWISWFCAIVSTLSP